MRWLLTASLITGMTIVPAIAQRAVSTGHAGGFSPSRGFAPPHIGGGFTAGPHFSPAPVMPQRNLGAAPQYHWSMPDRYAGNQSLRSSYGNLHSSPIPDRHYGQQRYRISRYRQPYQPYFYARSTYLVPGLLNSYWDYPDSSYAGDQSTAYPAQEQAESGDDYQPEPNPDQMEQAQDVPPPPPGPVEPLPQAAVTLVFKDGHSQQIHNYAMTRVTLYILDDAASGKRQEIALDTLDVPATEQTNCQAGVDFVVPTGTD